MHGLQVLDGLAERDRVKRATEAAKNELESYIIRTRERLEGDAAWEKATTPRERTLTSGLRISLRLSVS